MEALTDVPVWRQNRIAVVKGRLTCYVRLINQQEWDSDEAKDADPARVRDTLPPGARRYLQPSHKEDGNNIEALPNRQMQLPQPGNGYDKRHDITNAIGTS